MKKLSLNFGDKGLKGFAIDHVEKASLVLIVMLSVYFMYEGAMRESYQKGGPQTMKSKAAAALQNVTTDHTPDRKWIDDENHKSAGGHLARVEVASKDTESKDYYFGMINPPGFSPKSKRRDPNLYKIESLEVHSFRAAIYELTEAADPFANDPLAAGVKKPVVSKPAAKPERPKKGTSVAGGKKGRRRPPPKPTKPGEATVVEPPAVGVVSPKYKFKYIDGYRPESQHASEDAHGVTREFNVITGLLPYDKYLNEFDAVLGNSDGYDAARDLPDFLMLRVERAEVGANPAAPLEWIRLSGKSLKKRYDEVWAGVTEEIVEKKYIVSDDITFPMPPAMLTSPDKLGRHSKIPRADFAKLAAEEMEEGMNAPEAAAETAEDVPDTGGPMGPIKKRPGGPKPPKSTAPRPAAPTPAALAAKLATPEKIKYKLVRFYDFETEPGKKYTYRFSILLEDPNRPKDVALSPATQILDPTVVARLNQLDIKDGASGKRTFYRESPMSDPSPVVQAPTAINYVMGNVRYMKTTKIADPVNKAPILVKLEEVSGTLLPSVWSRSRGTEAAGNADIPDDPTKEKDRKPAMYYGTVLNFTKDVNVLRPDTLQIHVIKQAPFRTNAYVVDLRASEPLPITRNGHPGKLETPSEILIVDHTGKLVIHNELDDAEDFHRLTFSGELNAPSTTK